MLKFIFFSLNVIHEIEYESKCIYNTKVEFRKKTTYKQPISRRPAILKKKNDTLNLSKIIMCKQTFIFR